MQASVWDHPRLCGEKETNAQKIKERLGSPPPMRGKVLHDISCSVVLGITPAYAGKRLFIKLLEINSQDHPRLCGEKSDHANRTAHQLGSPPPMRGKVIVRVICIRSGGITPAYAGKSGYGFR